MSKRARSTGDFFAGLFLALFGTSSFLLGGGCSVMILWEMARISGLGSNGGFLLLALFVLAGGAIAIWAGFKLMGGRLS